MIAMLASAWSWFSNSTIGKWVMIIGGVIIAIITFGAFKKREGAANERAENNARAEKSINEARKIRDTVDQSDDAVRNDPDNRRNH